ncbi:MAG: helix-turn-helix transcriptional regulator [Actinobacteria bacterium]|nr:MAG: helix-turn-helix transcriptional regulator [Actinomycetota bacterium]
MDEEQMQAIEALLPQLEALQGQPFGQRLGRLREEKGLTQGELARAAGITRPYLTQVEGGRTPSAELQVRLAHCLGLDDMDVAILTGTLTAADFAKGLRIQRLIDAIREHLPAELYAEFLALLSPDSGVTSWATRMATLAGVEDFQPAEPLPGWSKLTAAHRRLIQQLVAKLVLAQQAEEVGTDGD